MVISNQKELSKLILLCRKHNIDEIEVDGIKLKLGKKEFKAQKVGIPLADIPASQSLTSDDILNWSASALDGAF